MEIYFCKSATPQVVDRARRPSSTKSRLSGVLQAPLKGLPKDSTFDAV